MPLSLGELAIVVVFLGAVLPKPVNQFVGDHLWGTVVEHEQGFRAQFAYPKNLYLPLKMLPITLAKIQSRLQALTLYGSDIFVIGNGETISLWDKDSGYSPAGRDYLIERSKRYYDRRQRDRTLKKGDRVAILGRGIAVVEQAGDKEALVVLWNKNVVRIGRREIVWDEGNMRWETDANAPFECLAGERVPPHRGQ